MLYNIVLVSAIHQHESDIGIHMPPPSSTSLPPPTPSPPLQVVTEPWFEFPESYSKFPLAIYFTYGGVYSISFVCCICVCFFVQYIIVINHNIQHVITSVALLQKLALLVKRTGFQNCLRKSTKHCKFPIYFYPTVQILHKL